MRYFIQLNLIETLNNDPVLRTELAYHLGVSDRAVYNTVRRYMKEAIANCPFTKLAAVDFFKTKGMAEEDIYYIAEQPET